MALKDDINNLPTTVGDGNTGHLNSHQVIHAGLKDHENRITAHKHTSEGITDGASSIPTPPNRVVKTNSEGKLFISTGSISNPGDVVNKAYVDGRVPDVLVPRLDTTVGTRIFMGTTMIYGDTGWRDVTSMAVNALAPGNTGKISVRRTTESLQIRFEDVTLLQGDGRLNLFTLPSGWRATQQTAHVSATVRLSTGGVQTITTEMSGLVAWFSERNSLTGVFTTIRPSGAISGILTVPVGPWPTSLIGTATT